MLMVNQEPEAVPYKSFTYSLEALFMHGTLDNSSGLGGADGILHCVWVPGTPLVGGVGVA